MSAMNERLAARARPRDSQQMLRFAIVGCLNVLISFVVFRLFYEAWPLARLMDEVAGSAGSRASNFLATYGIPSMDAAFANVCGYAAGMVNSFLLNKTWTFQSQGDTLQQMQRFLVLNVLGLLFGTLLLFIFVDLLHSPHILVWFISTAIVMALNFYGNKFWTFADTHRQAVN